MEAAALRVEATKASERVMCISTQAMFITMGMDMQCALGLKSLPSATGTRVGEKRIVERGR